MAVGDVTRVTLLAKYQQIPVVQVLHYETLTSFGPKQDEYDGLIDALEEVLFFKTLTNDMLDIQTNGLVYTEIQMRDEVNPTLGRDHLLNPTQNGKLTGDVLPQQVCCLVQKKTNLIGRSYSGRAYLFGATEDEQTNGSFNAGYSDDVAEVYVQMLAINSANVLFTFRMVVWSELLQVSNPVTSIGVGVRTRTQKRRNI